MRNFSPVKIPFFFSYKKCVILKENERMISLKARLFTIFILMFTLSSFAALSESFDDVFPPDSLQRNLAEKIVSDTGIRLIDYKTWHNKSETIQSVILTFPDEISVSIYFDSDYVLNRIDVDWNGYYANSSSSSDEYLSIIYSSISFFVPEDTLLNIPVYIFKTLSDSLIVETTSSAQNSLKPGAYRTDVLYDYGCAFQLSVHHLANTTTSFSFVPLPEGFESP